MKCFFANLRAEYALNDNDVLTIVNDSACLLSTRRIMLQELRSQFDRWAIFSTLDSGSDSMPSRPKRRRGYSIVDHEGSCEVSARPSNKITSSDSMPNRPNRRRGHSMGAMFREGGGKGGKGEKKGKVVY
jgi:hypothetical protein